MHTELPPLLGLVVEGMRESVMVTDADLDAPGPRILFVNKAFSKMTGYRPSQVLGHSPRLLQGPATDRGTIARLRQRLDEGLPFEGRAINYRVDGTPFVVEWYIEPVLDDRGVATHYLAVQRDVSDEERRESALRYLYAAFENSSDAIAVLSVSGTTEYCNGAGRLLFADGVPLSSEVWPQLRDGRTWDGTLEVRVNGERRRLTTTVRPVTGVYPGEQNYVVTASDITEVERLESIAQSVNLSKNIGHFLSGIRHELGNPTNSIKTALTVLRSNLEKFERAKTYEYLDHVLDEVGRIEHLLRSLRSFTAHESVQLEVVTVGSILDKVGALVRPDILRANVQFQLDDSSTAPIFVDPRALYQILINLISNAIEAIDGIDAPQIEMTARLVGTRVEILVIDNGLGISDSQIRRVIQPFYTTKRTGTGLGLAIVDRLVRRLGGELRLDSRPWDGTCAVVSLPVANTHPTREA
ncbi:MAG: PAS domain S-box protein [Deltaproteobacteria bacterium]|nr:PAS domain S-box protein [Deltaproteobacteria bacterium]